MRNWVPYTRTSKSFDFFTQQITVTYGDASNLPRLLFFQFLVATCVLQHRQLQPLALSLLQYICAATRDAKSTAVFNIQASVVLSSLREFNLQNP
jgi:hypothetical protein